MRKIKIHNRIEEIVGEKGIVVMTPNSEQLVNITYSSAYRLLYSLSTNHFCDSSFLAFYYSLFKSTKVQRITGVDVLDYFLKNHKDDIFIIGGSEKVVDLIGNKICDPRIIDFSKSKDIDLLKDRIRKCNKQNIFISIGSPRAELLVNILRPSFPEKNFYCVGNAINFCLGLDSRPPLDLKIPGIEAIYRTIKYPRILQRSISTLRIFFCLHKFKFETYE